MNQSLVFHFLILSFQFGVGIILLLTSTVLASFFLTIAFLAGDFFLAGMAFLALAVPLAAAVLAVMAIVLAFSAAFFGAAFAVFTAFPA